MNLKQKSNRSPIRSIKSMRALFLRFVLMCCICTSTQANELPARNQHDLWVNLGIYSHHFDQTKNLRDNNHGFGIEYSSDPAHIMMLGAFKNSNDSNTHYIAYQWRKMKWEAQGIQVYGGILVGAFDGYPNYRNGGWFLAPLPVLSLEGKRIGINISLIPKLNQRTDGALAFQLKYRVF